MPTIAYFYGMAIQMFFNDHNPPHFHVRYGSTRALIRIAVGRIISGELPPMARRIVEEWARARRGELEENWRRARARMPWRKSQAPMTNEFPMVDVIRVQALDGHRLLLRFSDGSEGVYDLSGMIAEGGEMVTPLSSPEYFGRVFVEAGVPTWPNGFDLDPINLYMELRGAGALRQTALA